MYMLRRKSFPSRSPCWRPDLVSTPPCLMMKSTSEMDLSSLRLLTFIWILRLIPEKWFWPERRLRTRRTSSSLLNASALSSAAAASSSGVSPPDSHCMPFARISSTTPTTSFSCSGFLSLAVPFSGFPCFTSKAMILGSCSFTFIFCLGVRSPWRQTAITDLSSSRSSASDVYSGLVLWCATEVQGVLPREALWWRRIMSRAGATRARMTRCRISTASS
mmetsp:Transcript_13170/g.25135  ORF Transcript_13170/g.25135 Transcript_13170/m.25135 type:complete len:219 (-) Transcript_13170:1043-1699(-)